MAFSSYKSLTLAESQSGTADSTDWPLAIALDGNVQAADVDLKTVGNGGYVQNANGYDIRPYADSALTTPLAYQLVYYQATTGKLEMHVKIPTLSTSVDTVIYLAFGDAALNTDGSSNTTWNSGYVGVWHLADGTTLSGDDSTSNANNGTVTTPTAATGQIDGGGNFVAASSDRINITNHASLRPAGAHAISGWIKTAGSAGVMFSSYDQTVAAVYGLSMGVAVTGAHPNQISIVVGPGTVGSQFNEVYGNVTTVNDNNWHHVFYESDGVSGYNVFVDGVSQSATDFNGTGGFVNPVYFLGNTVNIGREDLPSYTPPITGKYWNGQMDEIRFSNAFRGQSWATADYNSQKASSTFITWGARIPVASDPHWVMTFV